MLKPGQRGFTIVELMIATAAFSIILLLATGSIVEIGRVYYKSIIQSRTQETARSLSEEVTRSVQFAKNPKIDADPTRQFCIGDTRYTYAFNQKIDPATPGNIGVKASRIPPGGVCLDPGAPGKELLGKDMQLLEFRVEPVDANDEVYEVHIGIAHGDNDLLSPYDISGNPLVGVDTTRALPDALCKSNIAGSNFCAVSHLDNYVKKRLQ